MWFYGAESPAETLDLWSRVRYKISMTEEEVGVPRAAEEAKLDPHTDKAAPVPRKRGRLPIVKHSDETFSAANLMNLTGITKVEMRLLTSKGIIKAVGKNRMGWVLYGPEALRIINEFKINSRKSESEMPSPVHFYSTQEACAVFKMIKEGEKFDDIILKVKIHPRAIRAIIQEYENLTGAVVIYKEFVNKINALPLEGNFPIKDGAGVYDIMALASEDRSCSSCQNKRSDYCHACERRMILQNLRVRSAAKEPVSTISNESEESDE